MQMTPILVFKHLRKKKKLMHTGTGNSHVFQEQSKDVRDHNVLHNCYFVISASAAHLRRRCSWTKPNTPQLENTQINLHVPAPHSVLFGVFHLEVPECTLKFAETLVCSF